MKYQVGDKIVVLHSNEEGEITDIINDKMVMIDVRGVKFPAYMDQIDFPYFKQFSAKKMFPPKKEKKYIDDIRKDNGAGDALGYTSFLRAYLSRPSCVLERRKPLLWRRIAAPADPLQRHR